VLHSRSTRQSAIAAKLRNFSKNIGSDYVFNTSDQQNKILVGLQSSDTVMKQLIALYDTSPNEVVVLNKTLTNEINSKDQNISDEERVVGELQLGTNFTDMAFDDKVRKMKPLNVQLNNIDLQLADDLENITDAYQLVVQQGEELIPNDPDHLTKQLPQSQQPISKLAAVPGTINLIFKEIDKLRELLNST